MIYKLYQIRHLAEGKAILLYWFDLLTSLFIKSKSAKIKNPKKILLIRNDHIGDLVLCSGIFRELKNKYPKAEITALVSPQAKAIIEKNKNVDKIISLGLFWRKGVKGWVEYLKILREIKKENFDVGIDVRASLMNAIFLLWVPGIKRRVGYWNIGGGKAFLTNPLLFKKQEHTIKIDMNLVARSLNFKVTNYWPEIIVDEEDEREVSNFIKKNKLNRYVCICPGATNKLKQWPVERFDELIKYIAEKYPDYKILLVGGNEDTEIINKLSKEKCIAVINFNIRLLSLLFKRSSLVIANDGGPLHIAWVSNAKVVALWGPINLKLMKPLKNSLVIHHETECYPCHTEKCEVEKGKRCIELITVEEVEKVVKKMLR